MIEFVLLFALGFLTAVLLGLFIAPAVHGRIVRFTERRLMATVPMSAAELSAARDMERAAYAVENSRIATNLRRERDRRGEAMLRAERLQDTAARLHGEIADLEHQINTLTTEAGNLRSNLRRQEQQGNSQKLALHEAERGIVEREAGLAAMKDEMRRLSIELETTRIDLATREAEAEGLKAGLEAAQEERRRLRDQVKRIDGETKDYKYRLEREEGRTQGLEAKLAEAISKLTDQESRLDRREAEIQRLRDRLKAASSGLDIAGAQAALPIVRQAGGEADETADSNGAAMMNGHVAGPVSDGNGAEGGRPGTGRADKAAIGHRVEQLRARHAALVERLLAAKDDTSEDSELRTEIREIAAGMVSLTAAREGPDSPIHHLLAQEKIADAPHRDHPSLAERSIELMREER